MKYTSMVTQVDSHTYSFPHKAFYQQLESLRMSDTSGLRFLPFRPYLKSNSPKPESFSESLILFHCYRTQSCTIRDDLPIGLLHSPFMHEINFSVEAK